jgi:hypothetical protein
VVVDCGEREKEMHMALVAVEERDEALEKKKAVMAGGARGCSRMELSVCLFFPKRASTENVPKIEQSLETYAKRHLL